MTDAYTAQKSLEALVTGDVTPNLSTIDVLSSLKLLGSVNDIANNTPNVGLRKMIGAETKYLTSAMELLSSNRVLQDKFGNGLQGAMTLSGLLKSHHAKQTFDSVLDDALFQSNQRLVNMGGNNQIYGVNPLDAGMRATALAANPIN